MNKNDAKFVKIGDIIKSKKDELTEYKVTNIIKLENGCFNFEVVSMENSEVKIFKNAEVYLFKSSEEIERENLVNYYLNKKSASKYNIKVVNINAITEEDYENENFTKKSNIAREKSCIIDINAADNIFIFATVGETVGVSIKAKNMNTAKKIYNILCNE